LLGGIGLESCNERLRPVTGEFGEVVMAVFILQASEEGL
jgi:hypothetical protein